MTLREEIKPYVDSNGLVAPNLVSGPGRASDNGVLFTSEYYLLLQKNGELKDTDVIDFATNVLKCIEWDSGFETGILKRAPDDIDQEGPDDYYGLCAASVVLNYTLIAEVLTHHGYKTLGRFRNNDSSTLGQVMLWRQPQLLTAMLAASGWLRFYHLPLVVITALIIATSCMFADKNDTDARRLSWLLIQTMAPKSILCRLASKLWYRRLYKTYPNGMKDVASVYYQSGHPFAKYWID